MKQIIRLTEGQLHGIIRRCINEANRYPRGYWNYDTCKEVAKQCKSSGELKNLNKTAYTMARENGWINDYDWFEKGMRKSPGSWTYEACYEEAKNYSSRGGFKKGNPSAYIAAYRNNWLDDYTWFEPLQKEFGYWDYDACKEEAKKYTTRSEFHDGCGRAYQVARQNGWLDEYDWLQDVISWDYNKCYAEAKKYTNKRAFEKGCRGAYAAAWKHKWLDDYTWFVPLWEKKWDYDTCKEAAKKYTTRSEFKYSKDGAAYKKARENGWLDEYTWFVRGREKPVRWNRETCEVEATKYKTIREFHEKSPEAYDVAFANGWISDYTWMKKYI